MDKCPHCDVILIEGRLHCQGETVGWYLYCSICDWSDMDDLEAA